MQSTERQVEKVTLQLRQMIMAGEFAPGARIAEIPLAKRLGVSRTPVRLALGLLEQESLVVSSPRRGFVVREITVSEIVDAFDVRGALEALACQRALEHGLDDATGAELRECVAEGDRLLAKGHFDEADTKQWAAMNARFHAAIVKAARNKALSAALEFNSRLPLVAAGAIAFNTQTLEASYQNMQGVQGEHRDIVDALLRGQAGRAESLVREHAFKSREKLKARLESARARQRAQDLPGLRLVVG